LERMTISAKLDINGNQNLLSIALQDLVLIWGGGGCNPS
jgi:hypothetical protein